jgi:hypothetical protein
VTLTRTDTPDAARARAHDTTPHEPTGGIDFAPSSGLTPWIPPSKRLRLAGPVLSGQWRDRCLSVVHGYHSLVDDTELKEARTELAERIALAEAAVEAHNASAGLPTDERIQRADAWKAALAEAEDAGRHYRDVAHRVIPQHVPELVEVAATARADAATKVRAAGRAIREAVAIQRGLRAADVELALTPAGLWQSTGKDTSSAALGALGDLVAFLTEENPISTGQYLVESQSVIPDVTRRAWAASRNDEALVFLQSLERSEGYGTSWYSKGSPSMGWEMSDDDVQRAVATKNFPRA